MPPTAEPWESMHIPPRPRFPRHEALRQEHAASREAILDDDDGYDDLALRWRQQFMDPTVEATLPPPDTSRNALQSSARQLTTPGLYGSMPQVLHTDPAAGLVRAELLRLGWATKMQEVQFKTVGMGDYAVTVEATDDGLTLCPVSPADHFIESSPETPDVPHTVWRLRLRWYDDPVVPEASGYRWAWDVLSTRRDPLTGAQVPSYRVLRANPHYAPQDERSDEPEWIDDSALFLGADMPPGGYVGKSYPYRDEQGEPFLPWVWYRAHDTGRAWNYHVMRGLHRGTLMTSLHWTYASKAALSASGKFILTVGVAEPAAQIKESIVDETTVRSMALLPGTIFFGSKEPDFDGQPYVTEVGPGADLANLVQFCVDYEAQQYARWGLNSPGTQRVSDTPASGVSLYFSYAQKREFQARIEPLFRRSDLQLVRIIAHMMRLAGLGAPPTDGYAVVYSPVPTSPQERREQREAADWRRDRGQASDVQLYMERHPGITEEQAMQRLVRVRVEQAEVQRRVDEALALLGMLAETDDDETTDTTDPDQE